MKILCVVLTVALGFSTAGAQTPSASQSTRQSTPQSAPQSTTALSDLIESARADLKLPALALGYTDAHTPEKYAVTGVRKVGDPTRATLSDVWALGSISKSFTSTLLARLVEQKKLRWNSTLLELFPEVPMRPEYKSVTLETLLAHRSGLPIALSADLVRWHTSSTPYAQQRSEFVKSWLEKAPLFKPGSQAQYSNEGYILAAIVAERITGLTWEKALEKQVFGPLNLKSAGVGVAWPLEKVTQPWPHYAPDDAELGKAFQAVPPTVQAGNSPMFNGADNVRMSLPDLMKYARAHLNGEKGQGGLLTAATFQRLHRAPFGDEYALGWIRSSDGKAFFHNGSNTLNYALVLINIPASQIALTATNAVSEQTEPRLVQLLTEVARSSAPAK